MCLCLLTAARDCPPNSFRCITSGICIVDRYVCDDDNDCSDNSDERNCGNATRDVFEDNVVEAKAKAKATKCCPRGVLEVEASPRGPPYLRFLPCDATQRAVMPRRLSVHHSQIQRPTAASCVLMYEVLYLWY